MTPRSPLGGVVGLRVQHQLLKEISAQILASYATYFLNPFIMGIGNF